MWLGNCQAANPDRKAVPILIGEAGPRDGRERSLELNHSVWLAGTDQLVDAAASILFGEHAVAPIPWSVAEDFEVTIEAVAIAVEADDSKERIGNWL